MFFFLFDHIYVKAQKSKPRRGRRRVDSSDEEAENMSPSSALPRTQHGRGAKKKPTVVFNDSDDSDIELFEVDKTSKKKKGNLRWYENVNIVVSLKESTIYGT